jgi:hypothetical protein
MMKVNMNNWKDVAFVRREAVILRNRLREDCLLLDQPVDLTDPDAVIYAAYMLGLHTNLEGIFTEKKEK